MCGRFRSFKEMSKRNKWLFAAFLIVMTVAFSAYFVGFKLSFTNVTYNFPPFSSQKVERFGPMMSDVADNHYPMVYKSFYDGNGFSVWESDISLGRSTDVIARYMNPLNWVYLLPFDLAVFLKALTEFAIAFFGMYAFMRSLHQRKYTALVTALTYMFSSTIICWLRWGHSDVAALAPWLFFAIDRLIATVNVKYMFLAALVIYLMMLAGMPTFLAYFLYLAGIYLVVYTVKQHWKRKRCIFLVGGMFAVAVVLALAASLPYILSVAEHTLMNGYAQSRTHYSTAELAWEYTRTMLLPSIRKGFVHAIHENESTLHFGLAAVALAPLALVRCRKKPRSIFFFVTSLIVMALIFTNVFESVYSMMPAINTSMKYRVMTLLMFTAPVTLGLSLNDLITHPEAYRKKWWLFVIVAVWTGSLFFVSARGLYDSQLPMLLVTAAALLLIVGAVTCRVYAPRLKKAASGVLAAVVAINGLAFVMVYTPWIDASAPIIPEPTESVRLMQQETSQNEERITGIGMWTFFPNTAVFYGLNDVRVHGLESTDADFKTYFKAIDSKAYVSKTCVMFSQFDNIPLLQYLGVKCLCYPEGYTVMREGDMPDVLADVVTCEDGITVATLQSYTDKAELVEVLVGCETADEVLSLMSEKYLDNAAFIVGDQHYDRPLAEHEGVEVLTYEDDYVKLRCTTDVERYVTLNDRYDENWSVYINGEKAVCEKANYLTRAVKVGAGENIIIEWRYEPTTLYTMTYIALAVIALSVLGFALRRYLQKGIRRMVIGRRFSNDAKRNGSDES